MRADLPTDRPSSIPLARVEPAHLEEERTTEKRRRTLRSPPAECGRGASTPGAPVGATAGHTPRKAWHHGPRLFGRFDVLQ